MQVWVRRDAPGVQVIDDWNAFGQRTTASGSVVFDQVLVEEDQATAQPRLAILARAVPIEVVEHDAGEIGRPRVAEEQSLPLTFAGVAPTSNTCDPIDAPTGDDYLGPQDLGDYEPPKSKTVPLLIGVIVALVAVIGLGAVFALGLGDDLVALFKGELREKRIAEARMAEEAFEKEQLAKLDLFGNLMIQGNPRYALIKLDGQPQYGQTSAGWRELRVGTTPGIQDLKIKKPHTVEFSSPGFEPFSVEVTEGKWQDNGSGGYSYAVTPTLLPSSIQAKQEFDARMGQDENNEFFGTVVINTIPSGAVVTFDNKPLLDEKGAEMRTPVKFDRYWVKDEETGKLEEVPVRVDTTFDVGHKITIAMESTSQCPEGGAPECGAADGCCGSLCSVADDPDCKMPRYVTSLMRPMWTCSWKDGAPPTDIAKDKTIQHYCDYTYTLDLDLNGLKSYIVARAEERKRIMEQYKALEKPDAGTAVEGAETAQVP